MENYLKENVVLGVEPFAEHYTNAWASLKGCSTSRVLEFRLGFRVAFRSAWGVGPLCAASDLEPAALLNASIS